MDARGWAAVGAILAGTGVALGAFGAHGLRETLEAADQLETWRTAVRYQVWHGLALVLVALASRAPGAPGDDPGRRRSFALPAWAFLIGALFFSGSLYCLTLGVLRPVMGPVTPVGGLLLLVGWASFAWKMLRSP